MRIVPHTESRVYNMQISAKLGRGAFSQVTPVVAVTLSPHFARMQTHKLSTCTIPCFDYCDTNRNTGTRLEQVFLGRDVRTNQRLAFKVLKATRTDKTMREVRGFESVQRIEGLGD